MKKIVVILVATNLLSACKTVGQKEKRMTLINDFILAVSNNDTASLFTLVDTSAYFHVQTKEGFLFDIKYLNSRWQSCGRKFSDSSISIKEVPVYSKEYTIPFCRGKNGEIIYDSFDLLFTFADYDNDRKIHFIEVVKYKRDSTPIESP